MFLLAGELGQRSTHEVDNFAQPWKEEALVEVMSLDISDEKPIQSVNICGRKRCLNEKHEKQMHSYRTET